MFKIYIKMKQITLNIKESHYTLFVQFLRSLTYVEIDKAETTAIQPVDQQPDEVQIMIDYALTSENDKPSYGNAAEKQRLESADPKKKKFTVVKVAAADRNYTFNREELNAR